MVVERIEEASKPFYNKLEIKKIEKRLLGNIYSPRLALTLV